MTRAKPLTSGRFVAIFACLGILIPVFFIALRMFIAVAIGHDLSLEARLDEITFVFWPACLWLLSTYGGTKWDLFLAFVMSTLTNAVLYGLLGLCVWWLRRGVARARQ